MGELSRPSDSEPEVVSGEVMGGPVEFVRELSGWRGAACLVRQGDAHYVVSSVVAPYSGFETLVFPADAAGEITDWLEVAGGRGADRNDAIAELEQNGPSRG